MTTQENLEEGGAAAMSSYVAHINKYNTVTARLPLIGFLVKVRLYRDFFFWGGRLSMTCCDMVIKSRVVTFVEITEFASIQNH